MKICYNDVVDRGEITKCKLVNNDNEQIRCIHELILVG